MANDQLDGPRPNFLGENRKGRGTGKAYVVPRSALRIRERVRIPRGRKGSVSPVLPVLSTRMAHSKILFGNGAMTMHSPLVAIALTVVMVLGGILLAVGTAAPGAHASSLIPGASPSLSSSPEAQLPTQVASASLAPIGKLSPSQNIEISFTLASQNPAALAALIKSQGSAGSAYYGSPLSPSEYSTNYGPDPAKVTALESYLHSSGLTTSRIGDLLTVDGTVAHMEKALSVTLYLYHDGKGTAWAPRTQAKLPATFASVVGGITGLDTFIRPITHQAFPTLLPSSARPAAGTITVVLALPSFNFTYSGATYITPITGVSLSYTASITLPTGGSCAPCLYKWNFGDGTVLSTNSTSLSQTVQHTYVHAANQFTPPMQLSVNVTDTQLDNGQAADQVIPTMSAAWMQQAYNENPLFAKGFLGQGMTIGLDEMCDPSFDSGTSVYTSVVDTFSSAMGLPTPTLSFIGPGTSCSSTSGMSGWSQETVLDMDWAHAMAPDATIQVYFGASSSGADIAGGDSTWANASSGVFVASNSWGANEPAFGVSPGVGGPFDSIWNQAAAQGVTLFSSSGDCGGTGNNSPGDPSSGLNVSYPASIPTGVGVGGTIITTDTTGNWSGEYVWNSTAYSPGASCGNSWGTGGGWSDAYTQPVYQANMTGAGWKPPKPPTWPIANPRGVPDVAMDAATWVDIYYPGYGWLPTGGTSLASPMFAATMSVVLQAMNRHYNTTAPGFLDNPIYTIGKSVAYGSSFHDILAGNNNDPKGYSAATGWDPTTGWGSPDAANLVNSMRNALPLKYPVSGFVLNFSTGAPVPGASVTANNAGGSTTTAVNGSYTLYLVNGTYTLTATAKGFNNNTVGVTVNGTALKDENISITWIQQYGLAHKISGVMQTETHMPLRGGYVTVSGPIQASATSGIGGAFLLYLLNGTYSLHAYYTVADPVLNPAFNSTSETFTVKGPMNLVVVMYYTRNVLTGYVLDSATNQPLSGAFVTGFDLVSSNATTDSAGEFFLHLPTGTATISAGVTTYLPGTATVFVDWRNTSSVTILLEKSKVKPMLVLLALRVAAPLNSSFNVPQMAGNSSVTLSLWANNSTTGAPQPGVSVLLVDTLGGNFSHSVLAIPSTGPATVTYRAPFVTASTMEDLVATVVSNGMSGSNTTSVWVTSSTAACKSACLFPVSGEVLSARGGLLKGATLAIKNSLGSTIATVQSSSTGAFLIYEPNGSYQIEGSAAGYQSATVSFQVRGGPVSAINVILTANTAPIGSGKLVFNPYAAVAILIAATILVIGVLFVMRKIEKHRTAAGVEEEEIGPTPPPLPIDTQAEKLFVNTEAPHSLPAPVPPAEPAPGSSPPLPGGPGIPEGPKVP